MQKQRKKKLTYFPSGRRWPNATVTAGSAVWSRDDGAPRCCYYCCYYACAPCWRCCRWGSPARFYPPERSATVAFSWEFVWRPVVGASFARPRLSLRKTGLLYAFGLKASTLKRYCTCTNKLLPESLGRNCETDTGHSRFTKPRPRSRKRTRDLSTGSTHSSRGLSTTTRKHAAEKTGPAWSLVQFVRAAPDSDRSDLPFRILYNSDGYWSVFWDPFVTRSSCGSEYETLWTSIGDW